MLRQFTRSLSTSVAPSASSAISTLKVTVNGAGSKSSPAGLAHVVASSAFLDTTTKSGLRLKREAELLGGEYSAEVTRDALILKATFLKESLPFFVNTLGATLSEAAFKPHQVAEIGLPYAQFVSKQAYSCPKFKALEELHAVSFRSGLGKPLYYDGSKSYTSEDVAAFAKKAFLSENVSIEATGVEESALAQFIADSPFSTLPTGNDVIASAPKSYTGAETRIRAAGKTAAAIGFPTTSASSASELVNTLSAIESIGATEANVLTYEGASLVYFAVSGCAKTVTAAITEAAKSVKANSAGFNYVVVGDVDEVPLKAEL
ncbi:ubiquinol--cytochrome-c reductase subunit 2 [Martiniozyma asiatica (nom. inval.)]|nr:ubiquinol--cytochrome-c reductase subunit 2 [Martiniozyma asiatica]